MRATDYVGRQELSGGETACGWSPCWLWHLRQPRTKRDEARTRGVAHAMLDSWLTERFKAERSAANRPG